MKEFNVAVESTLWYGQCPGCGLILEVEFKELSECRTAKCSSCGHNTKFYKEGTVGAAAIGKKMRKPKEK